EIALVIVRTGNDPPSIGCDGHGAHAGMTDLRPTRNERLFVRCDLYAGPIRSTSGYRPQEFAGLQVPEAERSVEEAGDRPSPVGCGGDRGEKALAPAEGEEGLIG